MLDYQKSLLINIYVLWEIFLFGFFAAKHTQHLFRLHAKACDVSYLCTVCVLFIIQTTSTTDNDVFVTENFTCNAVSSIACLLALLFPRSTLH